MEKPIIEVKNIGKKYSISHTRGGYVALRDVITGIIKSPFSFLKHKTKQAVGLEKKEAFWALKNISFNVNKGEVVGIIGANGAGKSTLLKVLSQITPPTDGEIVLRGRIGSLLEVGTGFHPELTGRENIFLNGAILGMARNEITKKFDQIVEFAGIEKFLDTPVKFYSSGMYVRLAFSVAAHMEPDILLVDEVLAVGDAEFQKKCLGKMSEITKEDGRTIIFVSHNMAAIKQLCNKSILLKKGEIVMYGDTEDVISYYLNNSYGSKSELSRFILKNKPTRPAEITKIWLENMGGEEIFQTEIMNDIVLNAEYEVFEQQNDLLVGFLIDKDGIPIMYNFDIDSQEQETRSEGLYRIRAVLPFSSFKEGTYTISTIMGCRKKEITNPDAFVRINVINTTQNLERKSYKKDRPGFLISNIKWETKKI